MTQGYLTSISRLFVNADDDGFKKKCVTLVADLILEERNRNPDLSGLTVDTQLTQGLWCSHFSDLLMTQDLDLIERSLIGKATSFCHSFGSQLL